MHVEFGREGRGAWRRVRYARRKIATGGGPDRWQVMRIGGESPRYEFVPVPPDPASAAAPVQAAPGPSFADALHGIGGAVDRGEALIARAARGSLGGLDSGEFLSLLAGISCYRVGVAPVATLVARATSAVRTVVSPH